MKLRFPPGRRDLWLTSATIFLFWMSLYVYVPILPVYAETVKGAGYDVVGLIIASYGFTQLLLRIPFGYFSDILRRRKIFVVGGLLLSIASGLGLAAAGNPSLLILFRGLSGVAAATWAISTVWFASFFPPGAAVQATGMASFLAGIGQVFATGAGGNLAQAYGWQAPFLVAAMIAAVALLPLLPVVEKREEKRAFTISGSLRQTLGDRTLLVVSLAAAAGQFVTFATTYGFIPVYAADLGASRAQLGWLTSVTQVAYVVSSLGVGFLATSFYKRNLSQSNLVTSPAEKNLALMGLSAIGIAAFWVPAIHSIPILFLNRILHGLGNGLSYPVLMGLAIKGVPGERRALAMGAFQAIYALGMFAGPTLSGFLARWSGISSVFWCSGVLIVLTIPFVVLGLRLERQAPSVLPLEGKPEEG